MTAVPMDAYTSFFATQLALGSIVANLQPNIQAQTHVVTI
jgi:hypothetical protein